MCFTGVKQERCFLAQTLVYIGGGYRHVYNPEFVIIGILKNTNRSNDQKKDPSQSNHYIIKNAIVRDIRERYAEDLLNLDIASVKSRVLYDTYQNVRRATFGDEELRLQN